jgi:hypothetical protein
MKGLMTTVINAPTGKSYFVSTVKCRHSDSEHLWQSAVFRKIFGPFANFAKPQGLFLGEERDYLHAHVTTVVRDVDPADWDDKGFFISAEGDKADAAFEAMLANLRGQPAEFELS